MSGSFDARHAGRDTPPSSIQAFLCLCFAAGLFNDLLLFCAAMLNPHHSAAELAAVNPYVLRGMGGLIVFVLILPAMLLPYWLGLAFIYARSRWARGCLYFGAVMFLLMAAGLVAKKGLFSLPAMGTLVASGIGITALVCLGTRASQDWLRRTKPAFQEKPLLY